MSVASKLVSPLLGIAVLIAIASTQAKSPQAPFAGQAVSGNTAVTLSSHRAISEMKGSGAPEPVQLALNDPGAKQGAARMKPPQGTSSHSEPSEWVLVAAGVFLIAAVSHRRLTAMGN